MKKKKYQLLKQYANDNSNCKVPNKYPILGKWVCSQRTERRKGNLQEERIELLNKIGFIWDPSTN